MSNKLSIISDNGPDFLDSILISELSLMSKSFTDETILSFDFDKIKHEDTRNVILFSFFHHMNAVTYSMKYWLVFNNNSKYAHTDEFKQFDADYRRVLAVASKFHNKYRDQLNTKKLSSFIDIIKKISQEPVDFDLEGIDESTLAYLYFYFRLDNAYIENIKDDGLRGFAQLAGFGGVYVLLQFWKKKQDKTPDEIFNIMKDENMLDNVRRNFNNDNVLAFLLDTLNVYAHIDSDVSAYALSKFQDSLADFAYPTQSTLRKLAILSDRTIVNYFVDRLEEIKDPDESQKAALAKYKFYQERISAKYYKNIFTKENIDWYKAWIAKNLLKSTQELDDLLPDKVEAYEFLHKKFDSDTNTFLPNLIRGMQHVNFNYRDNSNVFIYSRIYAAMNHKELALILKETDGAKWQMPTELQCRSNQANMNAILDRSKINIIGLEGFEKHIPSA